MEFTSLEQYLAYVGRGRDQAFGRRFRRQFRDARGTAELAMLAAPSEDEYQDFRRTVAAMTDQEKQHVQDLGDEQIQDIARRGHADGGNVSIFLNGYVLARRQGQAQKRDS